MDTGQTSELPEAPPTDQAPSQSRQDRVRKNGFTTLYDGSGRDGKDALVDIIFVHGLGGGPEDTWSTSKSPAAPVNQQKIQSSNTRRFRGRLWPKLSSEKSAIGPSQPKSLTTAEGITARLKPRTFWPAEFLPAALPRARILTWGYESTVTNFFSGAVDKGNYFSHASDLLYDVDLVRAKNGVGFLEKVQDVLPVYLLVNSGGDLSSGLLTAWAVLLHSHSGFGHTASRPFKDIYESTKKVIFLGTPHRGSSMAPWGIMAARIVKAAGFDTNDSILKQLTSQSPELGNLNERFISLSRGNGFDIVAFQEAKGMEGFRGLNGKVVEDSSSRIGDEPQRTIPGNHIEMCKFSEQSDTGYLCIEAECLAVTSQTEDMTGGSALGGTGRNNSDRQYEPESVVNELFQHEDLSEHLMPDTSIFGDEFFLHGAIMNGDEIMARKLLARGAKIEEGYFFPTGLGVAVQSGKVEFVDLLLEYGAAIDKGCGYSEETPLMMATRLRSRTIVDFLLQRGADIQSTDRSGKTTLHIACEYGDESLVEFLLQRGARIEQKCSDSMDTPLLLATRLEQSAIVDLLVQQGAAIDATDAKGKTPLHIVSELGNDKIAKILLNAGANREARESIRQRTPLHYAAEKGNLAVAIELLQRKAQTNTQDGEFGTTALHLAAEHGHTDIVSHLISKGAAVDICHYHSGITALHLASENGHDAVVKILVRVGADVTAIQYPTLGGQTPPHLAAQNGHHLVLKLLCLDGSIDKRENSGNTALLLAVVGGHRLAVKTLLEKGAEIEARNRQGLPALYLALREGHEEVAILLLNEGAKITWPGATISPLQYAAQVGQISVVQKLLDLGADVRETLEHGDTALHFAASAGQTAILSLLLAKKAEMDTQNITGFTALHQASRNGYGDTVRLLLVCGANVTLRDNLGRTALHYAASRGHEDVVKLLIDKGADYQAIDENFTTPLHLAAECGHVNVIPWLLGPDAIIDAPDSGRRTPLAFACRNGHESTVKLLLAKGAQVAAPETITPLMAAAMGGPLGIVEILQSHRDGNCAIGDVEALLIAALNGDALVLKKLLSWEGLNINKTGLGGVTALHFAAINGHDSVIRMLLEKGAGIDLRSDIGWIPVHHAALNGHTSAIKTLLEAGSGVDCLQDMFTEDLSSLRRLDPDGLVRLFVEFARCTKRFYTTIKDGDIASIREQAKHKSIVNIRDGSGNTAIHAAIECKHIEALTFLCSFGIDVNTRNALGRTALYEAVLQRNIEAQRLLLHHEADVNIKDQRGHTALHAAVFTKQEASVKALVERGAEIGIKDNLNQMDALQYAEARGFEEVLPLLSGKLGKDLKECCTE